VSQIKTEIMIRNAFSSEMPAETFRKIRLGVRMRGTDRLKKITSPYFISPYFFMPSLASSGFASLWLSILLGLSTACTRDIENTTARLRFQTDQSLSYSKVEGLAVDYRLAHIVINIRGSGIPDVIVWDWDGERGKDCCDPAPVEVNIEAPSGPGRLIQYVGVYKNILGNGLLTTYADALVDLASGDQAVTLVASQYGEASGKEAVISGQYVTSLVGGIPVGPTGKIDVLFVPPNGRPDMTVSKGGILNGWFQIFAIDGIPFKYRVSNNTEKFLLQGVSFQELASAPAKASEIQVSTPSEYIVDYGGTSPAYPRKSGGLFLGFYGPAVDSTFVVCYPDDTTLNSIYKTASPQTNHIWSKTFVASEFSLVKGGALNTNAVCLNADQSPKVLNFDAKFKNGERFASGMKGGFKRKSVTFSDSNCNYSSDERFIPVCRNAGNIELKWNYLSGVATVAQGSSIFIKDSLGCSNNCYGLAETGDGFECDKLESLGFQRVGDKLAEAGENSFTFAESLAPEGSKYLGVVCPYIDTLAGRKYFASAASFEIYDSSSNGTGNNLGILNVQGLETGHLYDSIIDNFLVGTSSNEVLVSLSGVPAGMAYYSYVVKESGSGAIKCSLATADSYISSPITLDLSTCSLYSDEPLALELIAYDATQAQIDATSFNFTRIYEVPTLTSLSVAPPVNQGGFVQFNSTNVATQVSNYDIDTWTVFTGTEGSHTVTDASTAVFTHMTTAPYSADATIDVQIKFIHKVYPSIYFNYVTTLTYIYNGGSVYFSNPSPTVTQY